jgi:hypothetical protein
VQELFANFLFNIDICANIGTKAPKSAKSRLFYSLNYTKFAFCIILYVFKNNPPRDLIIQKSSQFSSSSFSVYDFNIPHAILQPENKFALRNFYVFPWI